MPDPTTTDQDPAHPDMAIPRDGQDGPPGPGAGTALAAPAAGGASPQRPGLPARALSMLTRHWLFAAVLAGAAALRVVVMLGYPPAMWFNDSFPYVDAAVRHGLSPARPAGYAAFLTVLLPLHSFALVVAVQHLMGLAMGIASYALLRRRGLPAWGASLAAAPVLFDAYQVQLEQQIMSDALFMVLVVAVTALLCWNETISVRVAAAAGLLTGLATIVRSVGLPLLAVVAVCLLIWRAGWRPLAALLAGGTVPVAGYMLAFHSLHGQYAITDSAGTFLYGRVMTFADCAVIKPPASLTALCDPRPPAQRPVATEYIWRASNPLRRLGPIFSPQVNGLAQQFAVRAIEAQPAAYLHAVATDLGRSFAWARTLAYDRRTDHLYLFSNLPPPIPRWASHTNLNAYQPGLAPPGTVRMRAVQPFAGFLAAYQREFYLRGILVGLLLLAGLAGVVARWRRHGGPGLLPWLVGMQLLILPVAVADFDYRYELAVVPFACLAAALASARGQAVAAAP